MKMHLHLEKLQENSSNIWQQILHLAATLQDLSVQVGRDGAQPPEPGGAGRQVHAGVARADPQRGEKAARGLGEGFQLICRVSFLSPLGSRNPRIWLRIRTLSCMLIVSASS